MIPDYTINTAPLLAPPTRSPLAEGMSQVGNVLDAIIARRQQQQQFDEQQALRKAEEERLKDAQAQQFYIQQKQDERLRAQEEAQQAHQQAQLDLQQQQKRGEAVKTLGEMFSQNRGAAAPAYLSTVGAQLKDKEIDPMDLIGTDEEVAKRREAVKGKKVIDFGNGQTVDFDPSTLGPESQAAQIEKAFAGLPRHTDPRVMRAYMEASAAVKAGAVRPESAYATVIEPRFAEIEREKIAAQAKRRGGPKVVKENPGLDILDRDGAVIGIGRSKKEAEDQREARSVLEKAHAIAEQLKADLDQNGNLLPIWDANKQGPRDTKIDQLVEARKQITGAQNEADTARYKKQFDTSVFGNDPEGAKKAIDEFVQGLEQGFDARTKSSMAKPIAASKPTAKREIAVPTDDEEERLKAGGF